MNKIEITTTQNVTVEYELSPLIYRIIAFLLDFIILMIGCLILELIQEGIIPRAPQIMFATDLRIHYLTATTFIFYSLAFEHFNNGQSIGKKALSLRVIRADGEKTQFLDYLMRWVFRLIDIYVSFGFFASLGVMASSKNQRLGDFLANTVVVRVGKTERMKLQNLLRLNQMKKYTPTYPQVIKMEEESMLVVKETIERHKKNPNYAHQKALELLVSKMEKELNIVAPTNKTNFLKILLKDYVVLTR